MDKVFVINHTTQDLGSAKKYGTLEYVTVGNVPIFKTELMQQFLREKLILFREEDYLLVAGPAWLTAMATAMLCSKYKKIKFLIFDAKQQQYTVRHLQYDSYSLIK